MSRDVLTSLLGKPFFQFAHVGQEPNLVALVRFVDKGSKCFVLGGKLRDIANDRESYSVIHKFLEYSACELRPQLKEIRVKPGRGCDNQSSGLRERLCDNIHTAPARSIECGERRPGCGVYRQTARSAASLRLASSVP